MQLSPKTKVLKLIEEYPYLIDFLADYSGKFAGFRNPILRKTFGRAASLGKVASMDDIAVDKLIYDIRDKIKNESGIEIDVDLGEMPLTTEERREVLKDLIRDLHAGTNINDVKRKFMELVEDVSPTEISLMEQDLIDAGMPQDKIQHLCDAHANIFKESLSEYELPEMPAGHPVHTYHAENDALSKVMDDLAALLDELGDPPDSAAFAEKGKNIEKLLDLLSTVDLHYQRKENQLFPFLEKVGVSGPPHVMWGVHDEIRAMLKDVRKAYDAGEAAEFSSRLSETTTKIRDMIFKEHYILFPMALEMLKDQDWLQMRAGEDAIGYALITPGNEWPPEELKSQAASQAPSYDTGASAKAEPSLTMPVPGGDAGFVSVLLNLETGSLTPEQANLLFNHLPVEISFTDENHIVRFFSEGKERIFPRSPGVIGRRVENCHPPKSVHMVRRILESFVNGERDVAEFWITLNDKFIYIRYFAIRDAKGKFRGTMEVVQDVTGIRELEGERRLLDWE